MARAYQTALPLVKLRPKVPFTVSKDLREITGWHGIGHPADQKRIRNNASTKSALRCVASSGNCANIVRGDVVLVVPHGVLMRALLPALGGKSPDQRHAVHHFSCFRRPQLSPEVNLNHLPR